MTVLGIGAAGERGGFLVPALVQRSASVRGHVRQPEQVETVKGRRV